MSLRKLKIILEMIKFEHSLFALPFAFMGAVLGNIVIEKAWPTWMEIFWVTVAMVGARSAAMSLNRVIDRLIDAKNPRTANRAIPAGLISIVEVTLFIVVSFAVLFIAAFQLNDLAVKLLPLAVFVLVLYSYTKRFTWLCHLCWGLPLVLVRWVAGWLRQDRLTGLDFSCSHLCSFGQLDLILFMLARTVNSTEKKGCSRCRAVLVWRMP